jgi:hypothetical protein
MRRAAQPSLGAPLRATVLAASRTDARLPSASVLRGTVESAPLILLRFWLAPVIVAATLLRSLWLSGLPLSATCAVLALSAFSVSRHVMSPLELARSCPSV